MTHMRGGGQVSSELAVHVSAKTQSRVLQDLWGNNLNHRAIRDDLQALLWDVNRDDVVLEELDNSQDPSLRVLLDELLSNNWVQLLTAHHNLHWQGQGVGEKLIKKNSEGRILAIVQLFKDNVISGIPAPLK